MTSPTEPAGTPDPERVTTSAAPAPSPGRDILRLAVPAFLALVAEPLFLLTDSAIVGHLGTAELAGLGVASAILLTAVGIFVFLAYGTTSVVSRQLGAGDLGGAVAAGIDGTWLGLALGAVTAVITGVFAHPLCRLFGASDAAVEQAATYLRISAIGIPAMLVTMAVTGVLRGLQDTRTPLIASVTALVVNASLNLLFVHGLGWGIAGSAWGTVITQLGMALALVAVLVRSARRHRASVRPHPGRVLTAALGGIPLLVRTLALRAILLVTTWVAAGLGDVPLAAFQVSTTIWSFLTFALDALAIAAQALTGKALGAGDIPAARSATQLMIRWGVWGGVALGLGVLVVHRVLPAAFTGDPAVQAAIAGALVVVALGQPLSGYVFVVDGVLIGAGDGRWLAGAMVATLGLYLPVVLVVRAAGPRLLGEGAAGQTVAVMWLWAAFTCFMAIRGAFFWWRIRGDRWMVTGASR